MHPVSVEQKIHTQCQVYIIYILLEINIFRWNGLYCILRFFRMLMMLDCVVDYFFLSICSYVWGLLADKYNKKTILMYSGICVAFSSLFFGFSVNFYMAVIFRFLSGLSNGTTQVNSKYILFFMQELLAIQKLQYMNILMMLIRYTVCYALHCCTVHILVMYNISKKY